MTCHNPQCDWLKICFDQSAVLWPRSDGLWWVIHMEFLQSFHKRHLGGNQSWRCEMWAVFLGYVGVRGILSLSFQSNSGLATWPSETAGGRGGAGFFYSHANIVVNFATNSDWCLSARRQEVARKWPNHDNFERGTTRSWNWKIFFITNILRNFTFSPFPTKKNASSVSDFH